MRMEKRREGEVGMHIEKGLLRMRTGNLWRPFLDGLYCFYQVEARLSSRNDSQRQALKQLLEEQERQSKPRCVVLNFTKMFLQSILGPTPSPEFCIAQKKG